MGKLAIVPGVLLLLLPPAPVAAQDRAPKFTIGAGAGIANPFHGDLSFTAATWEASVRGAAGRHVQIDAVAGEWIHDRESLRLDLPIHGPSGVIGRIGRLVQRTEWRTWSLGVDVLPTFSRGRVRVWGGGGGAYVLFTRRSTSTLTDCTSTSPAACNGFESRHTSSSLAAQFAAGTDVSITDRVLVSGQYRLAVPFEDPGSGHAAVLGGVRVALR